MGDAVEHPDHYNEHPSGVECIDIVEHMGFNLGNVVKYVWRADLKHDDDIEDLKKAAFYLEREIARRSGEVKGKAYLEGFEDGVEATIAQNAVGWRNPVTLTQEARAESIQEMLESDMVRVGLTDPYGAFAGRNLESATFYAEIGVIPQTFVAGMKEEDLTEEQKQKIAEEMAKPMSKVTPDARCITLPKHLHPNPSPFTNWVEDYDAQYGTGNSMRMYAVPPEQHP